MDEETAQNGSAGSEVLPVTRVLSFAIPYSPATDRAIRYSSSRDTLFAASHFPGYIVVFFPRAWREA